MIELRNVGKRYGNGPASHEALRNINISIQDGEVFGVLGSSGAGKSTLVRCINLLERPTSGQVLIDGVDVTNMHGKELAQLRSHIGMIFQNFSLFQQRTAIENVQFPLEVAHMPREARKKRAERLLELVGLQGLEQRYPAQLSGGQQQRVAIARALATDPTIMLCDEATSALDSTSTAQVLDLLQHINRTTGVTMVVITHSLQVARALCDRVAVIDSGSIVEQGPTETLFAHPTSETLRTLLEHEHMRKDYAATPSATASVSTEQSANNLGETL